MRISLGLSSRMPLVEYARAAVSAGLDGIWVGEHVHAPLRVRTLVQLSDAVPELPLGTAIVSIYVHDVEELVALGERMAEHPSGFSLGVGVGDVDALTRRGIVPVGAVERMARYIERLSCLRELGVRVVLGSTGRRMLERLSHEVDGVVLTGPVEDLRDVVELCGEERLFWLDAGSTMPLAQLAHMGIREVIVGPPRGDDVDKGMRELRY